jgi:hypothetical protein
MLTRCKHTSDYLSRQHVPNEDVWRVRLTLGLLDTEDVCWIKSGEISLITERLLLNDEFFDPRHENDVVETGLVIVCDASWEVKVAWKRLCRKDFCFAL